MIKWQDLIENEKSEIVELKCYQTEDETQWTINFENSEVFRNDKYFGKIITKFIDGETLKGIQVKVDNGNIFLKGQVLSFHFELEE